MPLTITIACFPRLTAALVACLLATLTSVPAHASGTTLTISPATSDVQPGDHLRLQVVLNTDTPTRGLQFGISYDPQLIQIDDVSMGPFYSDWADSAGAGTTSIPFVADNSAGRISIGGVAVLGGEPDSGATGSGVVLNLQATAREGSTGQSSLQFMNVVVSNAFARAIPEVAATGAVLQVGGASAEPGAPAPQLFGPTPGPTSPTLSMAALPPSTDTPPATSSAPAWPLVAALAVGVGVVTYGLAIGLSHLLALRSHRRGPS
jgi:hypothetical protein